MPVTPADLGKFQAPNMAFSKIQNVRNLPEDQAVEFFNGLYQAAVLAKDDGNWKRIQDFLEQWEQRLVGRARPDAMRFETSPWKPFEAPLRGAKVALIGTGGIYIKEDQQPFNTDGDFSYRVIPKTVARDRLGVAHTHYDTTGAQRDINVIFPYERLKELEAEGIIGTFADECYGFMGYIPGPLDGPMVSGLMQQSAPEVAKRLLNARVDAVLIGTT